jgi:hypothetical protein
MGLITAALGFVNPALPALKLGWGFVKSFGPIVLVGLFFGLWHHSAALDSEHSGQRDRLIAVVTQATVPPDKAGNRKPLSPDDAVKAELGIIRERNNKATVLDKISASTKAAKIIDTASDAHLADTQSRNIRDAIRSSRVIADLASEKATGNAATDAAAIDKASQTAWANWETAK